MIKLMYVIANTNVVNANTTCMLMLAVAVSLMLMYVNLANV